MTAEKADPAKREEDELIHRLFLEEYTAMLRTASYALGDDGLAETAVQETFVVALRFREKLAACEKPTGWLYNALRYTIKHIQRDRSYFLTHTVPLDGLREGASAHYDAYSLLDDALKDSEDLKLLAEFYYKGYSIRELAQRMGVSVGACKMRLKRAKERLRKKLE